ncbi:MAG: hypothetical protein HC772_18295 [Leptolyngbyaceae cyanobacterium CRU_2_3]|nr:hypothetical protein [Leptolyngbyaceae cyanobacterium CRU_2_3]
MYESNLRILPIQVYCDRAPIPLKSRLPQTSFPVTPVLLSSVNAEAVLKFDWRKLTALGVSLDDAEAIAQTLVLKKIMSLYWRRLIRVEVPTDDARRIARAVAKYDAAGIIPTPRQQRLISQYCPLVCRAKLWRAELLLASRG